MARWSAVGNKGAASVKSVLTLTAAAASMRRAKVYDWTMGSSSAPADNTFTHIAQRQTAAATGAAVVPSSLDPADTLATTIIGLDTVTVDGTLTAATIVFRKALNQRATFRWVAAPYGELIIPATASNGFMFGVSAATTNTFDYDVHFEEY